MLMQKDTAFCKAVYKEQQVCFVFQSLYILRQQLENETES